MILKNRQMFLFFGGFLFALDQACKYVARTHPEVSVYILKPWLGWEFFANPGIGFSLPFPNAILIIATPIILLIILYFLGQKKHELFSLSLILIFAGALSNFIDRLLFAVTIDYIRIATAVINIADLLIVAGALIILHKSFRQKTEVEATRHD